MLQVRRCLAIRSSVAFALRRLRRFEPSQQRKTRARSQQGSEAERKQWAFSGTTNGGAQVAVLPFRIAEDACSPQACTCARPTPPARGLPPRGYGAVRKGAAARSVRGADLIDTQRHRTAHPSARSVIYMRSCDEVVLAPETPANNSALNAQERVYSVARQRGGTRHSERFSRHRTCQDNLQLHHVCRSDSIALPTVCFSKNTVSSTKQENDRVTKTHRDGLSQS